MVSRGVFYGVVAVLLAGIILSSSFAVFYYYSFEEQSSASDRYVAELHAALGSYNTLSKQYSASQQGYRETLSLLVDAVANLNTSTPAYVNASEALSSLWTSYQGLAAAGGNKVLAYGVHMAVDFGNGTRRWYNDSSAEPGWNGYVVTLVLLGGNVQATWYPQYSEHFVTGVDGVPGTDSKSWFVWVHGPGGWTASQTGADGIQVNNGTTFAWTLCGYDANYNPACSP